VSVHTLRILRGRFRRSFRVLHSAIFNLQSAISFLSLSLALSLCLAGPAQAVLVTGVTATGSHDGFWNGNPPTVADNSGMIDAALPRTVNYSFDPAKPTHDFGQYNEWAGLMVATGGWITFTFDDLQTVEEFAVWNFGQNGGGPGVKNLNISMSTDGSTFTQQISPVSGTTLWTFARAPSAAPITGQGFVLPTAWTGVKAVKFGLLAGATGNYGDGSTTGLAEVRFYTPMDLSEPMLMLAKPTGRTVFQRNDSNLAQVTVQGGYTGTVSTIEARAVPMDGYGGTTTDWQTVSASPSGGTFAGSITVPGGWYRIETRAMAGGSEVASSSVDRIGVGEVFITAGQSNSANYGSPAQSATDDRVSEGNVAAGMWTHSDDPQAGGEVGNSGGSPWPDLGDMLVDRYGVPVGFISTGIVATVSEWQVGSPNHYYSRIQDALTFAEETGGVRAVLWHQGESDSLAGTSAATYEQFLENIIAQSRIDAGYDLPWGVALAAWHPGVTDDAKRLAVLAGEQAVIDGDPLVFLGANTDEMQLSGLSYRCDSVHFNDAGLYEHARRWDEAIAASGIVPEPATIALMTLGIGGLLALRRRKRNPGAESITNGEILRCAQNDK